MGSFWWSMCILPSCPTLLSSAGWCRMMQRCHSCSDRLFLMEHVDSTFLSNLAIKCWWIHQPSNDPPLSQLFRRALSDGACGFYLAVLPCYRVLVDTPAVEGMAVVHCPRYCLRYYIIDYINFLFSLLKSSLKTNSLIFCFSLPHDIKCFCLF